MKYIIGKHIFLGLLAAALVLLTGCQSDGADTGPKTITVEMQAYATTYKDAVQAASTRAWPPSGFSLYTGNDAIRVAFMTLSGYAVTDNVGGTADGSFVYSNEKWYSTFAVKDLTGPYYLYGYMPAVGSLSLAPVSSSYANGAIMTMTGLPSATSSDVCVIVGVGNSTNDIQMGKFDYTFDSGNNHVYLLCDHLYAALGLSIYVHDSYYALRRIKLKKVWVKDCKNGGTTYTSKSDVVVRLESNNEGTSPIQNITFTNDNTNTVVDMEQSPLYNNAEGLALSGDKDYPTYVQGFMAPIGMTDFTLVSQYDVYDTKGNLIRPDQIAENKINIDALFDKTNSIDRMSVERGKRYILQLIVNPTYLYMMSEPDLDNPSVQVGSL